MTDRSLLIFALTGSLMVHGQIVEALGATERMSIDASLQEPSGASDQASVSADGRLVAFRSNASNLVANDSNGQFDIFVRDRNTGTVRRVSVNSEGTQSDGRSSDPVLSADGRSVVFHSDATNLVGGDTNGVADVFVHDLQSRQTQRISVASNASEGNGPSIRPAISADGRFIAFESESTNLVVDDTNGASDIFVHDRQNKRTTRVNRSTTGGQSVGEAGLPAISADGRFIAYASTAFDLVADDSNGVSDVFITNRQSGTTQRVSVATTGAQSNAGSDKPSISADGRFVAFRSSASNLVSDDNDSNLDIYLRDRQSGTTLQVSSTDNSGNGGNSDEPAVSADGRFVAFDALAGGLVDDDTNRLRDVFLYDRLTRSIARVSVSTALEQATGASFAPSLSADGRWIAFSSNAPNLVASDSNALADVFLRDRRLNVNRPANILVSVAATPNAVTAGTELTYTARVNNKGPFSARRVGLTQIVSSNIVVNALSSSKGSCLKSNLLVCHLGHLRVGEAVEVTVQGRVTSRTASPLATTVAVHGSGSDPRPNNNRKIFTTPTSR